MKREKEGGREGGRVVMGEYSPKVAANRLCWQGCASKSHPNRFCGTAVVKACVRLQRQYNQKDKAIKANVVC